MTLDGWPRVKELFHAALECAPADRTAFLSAACGDDETLCAEVERLLAAHAQARGFIEVSPVAAMLERPAAQQAMTGRGIAHYEVGQLIGAGGTGEVYVARDTDLRRTVALKVVTGGPLEVLAVRREAQHASQLNHPHICTIHEVGVIDDHAYIAMEYIDGRPLSELIGADGLPLETTLRYGIQIADALAHAHARGVVHRDLKSANVVVTSEGRAKVLDFGLSQRIPAERVRELSQSHGALLQEGGVAGTLPYMAPELLRGELADTRSDIWALGIVLYEMAAGRRPFEGGTAFDLSAAILDAPPAPLPLRVPAALKATIRRCLAKDPHERYGHAVEVRSALEVADVRFVTEDSTADGERTAVPRTLANRSGRLWHAVGATLLLAGAFILSWWTGRQSMTVPAPDAENPLASARFTRFTDFPGSEWDAAISPDGKFVVFLSDRDGPIDVWLSQVGTGRFTNLTQGREVTGDLQVRNVGISHDGSEIWLAGILPDRRLRLMPLIGGTARTFLPGNVVNVAWSPDGALLAYHTPEPGDPMFVADRTGGNARQIFVNPIQDGHNHFPTWSLDGRWIYFVTGPPPAPGMDLWRIAPSGGAPERLTHHDSDVTYPIVLDSRTVLYLSPAEDGSGPWLWMLDNERKTTRRASFGLEKYVSLAASADGRRLVTTVSNAAASLWSVPILDRPAQDADVKPFPVSTVRALAPRFGGDGLFYLSSLGSGDGLWRYREKQVLEIWKGANGTLRAPAGISSDGKRVAISLRGQGRMQLNVMSDDGTGLEALADTIDVRGSASWSPDGRWIATGGRDGSGPGLFKVPVAGGAPVRLVAGAALNPVWSPDGSFIVYAPPAANRYAPLLAVRPDGTPVQLPAIRLYIGGERYRFLPDGRGLVYMQGDVRSQNFWLLDLATRKSKPLTQLSNRERMRTFDITPDGKQIVFDRLQDNTDIVLIDLPR